jgi:periplasmic copper chaperone A
MEILIKNRTRSLVLLITFLISACRGFSNELTLQDAWARPAKIGENGAIYLRIENGTNAEDVLLDASTDVAEAAEAHMSMQNDQGVVSMHQQETVQVPAGEDVEFEPGKLHMMLVNLKRDLKVGDVFIVKMRFQNAGEIKLQVEVKEK